MLAERVGVLRVTIARWETGKTVSNKADLLLDTSDALEVSLRWLLGRSNEEGEISARISNDELGLVRLYRAADPGGKKFLLDSFMQINAIQIKGAKRLP